MKPMSPVTRKSTSRANISEPSMPESRSVSARLRLMLMPLAVGTRAAMLCSNASCRALAASIAGRGDEAGCACGALAVAVAVGLALALAVGLAVGLCVSAEGVVFAVVVF